MLKTSKALMDKAKETIVGMEDDGEESRPLLLAGVPETLLVSTNMDLVVSLETFNVDGIDYFIGPPKEEATA